YQILFILLYLFTYSQVGINTTTPNADAALDINSNNKGLLIPRVVLVALSDPAPLSAHVKGMIVYNLSSVNSTVTEGFYYNDGFQWTKVNKDSSTLVSFNTTDPNQSGTVFSPNLPANFNNIYASSIDGSYWKYDQISAIYISYQPDPSTEWYLGGTTTDASFNKTNAIYRTGEVGIGSTSTIDASAMLDVNSKTKGLLPPRMTQTERDAITQPAEGLMVYCTDCNVSTDGLIKNGCLVYNYGTPAAPLWECLGRPKGAVLSVDCVGSSINGDYIKGVANSASNTVIIKVVNNSFQTVTNDFTGYLTLLGSAAAGLTVSGPSPAQPVNIPANSSVNLVYTISGTPTVAGDFRAKFSGNGLECEKVGTVRDGAVTPDCANAVVALAPFKYLKNGTSYSGTITIPYTSTIAGIAYPAQTNISIGNGLTVSRSAGTFGLSGTVVYTIGGTYTGTTCQEMTANINIVGTQSCSVKIGVAEPFLSGTYASSLNTVYYPTCVATQANMTDNDFASGWANDYNTTGTGSTGGFVEITFPEEKTLKEIKISTSDPACWGAYSVYGEYYTNAYTNYWKTYGNPKKYAYEIQYWNGTAWVYAAEVPVMSKTALTTIPVCEIKTTKIRVTAVNAAYWAIGTFYPVVYK
ncbi:hypothetical protein HHL23_22330, partial [Chryseobacterium sp. RP-3-3]|nr:hypothetical protein [Chryseobacterium antibioticum]